MGGIDSPYNFAPLSPKVFLPDEDWAQQVSHDLPFADGLSGVLDYTLHAHTPLLVGQERRNQAGGPGEVYPFVAPDGRHGIPGSSLRGMIRGVLEVAAFGRMGYVDDNRYALRDISGKHVRGAYSDRIRRIKAGFIQRDETTGLPILTRCDYVHVSHRRLEEWLKVHKPLFRAGMSVSNKYATWRRHAKGSEVSFNAESPDTSPRDQRRQAVDLGNGNKRGILMFTGQISDSTKPRGKRKRHDFIFYDERPESSRTVTRSEWRDFLFVHTPAEPNKAGNMSWPGYWEARYFAGEKVPVFYLESAGQLRLGLAFLPRLAGDYSVHDSIHATGAEHLNDQHARPDLPALLFGYAETEGGLRGRVAFEPAFADKALKPQTSDPVILNGPKPSFFPAYLEQPGARAGALEKDKSQYATYVGNTPPRLRGWKRYPVRENATLPSVDPKQKQNAKVQSILHPLPPGSRFVGRVVFHNLRPAELGALLWSLTWGGQKDCNHSLGMGKPFGYGAVSMELGNLTIEPNDPATAAPDATHCCSAFEAMMGDWSRTTLGIDWLESPQLKQLLGMANPANETQFPNRLRYPSLANKDFQQIKNQGFVLRPYIPTDKSGNGSQIRETSIPQHHQVNVDAGDAGGKWLRDKLTELERAHNAPPDQVLRGKPLVAAWQAIEDEALKTSAREAIIAAWKKRGYWDSPQGKAAKRSKAVYENWEP